MIIGDGWCFVAVPKTGSLTITRGLRGVGKQYKPYHGWESPDLPVWLVIRSTVPRMVSWWWMLATKKWEYGGMSYSRFLDYAEAWKKEGTPHGDVPELFMSQSEWIERTGVAHVLRFKMLPEDFGKLPFDTDELVDYWKKHNDRPGLHKSADARITESERRRTLDIYSEDAILFGD